MTAPQDPRDDESNQDPFIQRIKKDKRVNKGLNFIENWWLEAIAGCLMLVGIVLSFFYSHIGGMFVGLAFGLCFFEQIRIYFSYARRSYALLGLFKTVMWIGVLLYFLIVIPVFILSTLVGFGILFLIRRDWKL